VMNDNGGGGGGGSGGYYDASQAMIHVEPSLSYR